MKIVAIGGGEIGRPGTKIETRGIDERIIALTGKKKPKLLFIPTASFDSVGYCDVVKNYFGGALGCKVSVLCLLDKSLTQKSIKEAIYSTDIVYVGGGNTEYMMRAWRKLRVDQLLRSATKKGVILSGLSAGAICWFRYGNSDSRRIGNPDAPLIRVRGTNLIPALFCPHYDVEKDREDEIKEVMKRTPGVAICAENGTAIEIVDDSYQMLRSIKKAKIYKVYWKRGVYYKEEIKQVKEYRPLKELLSK